MWVLAAVMFNLALPALLLSLVLVVPVFLIAKRRKANPWVWSILTCLPVFGWIVAVGFCAVAAPTVKFAKLTTGQTLGVIFLGLLLGALPVGLGLVLGFVAFLATPIFGAGFAVLIGLMITRFSPDARWTAVVLASLVTSATNTGLLLATSAILSVGNGTPFQPTPYAIAMVILGFVMASCVTAAFISAGVLLGRLGKRRASPPPSG